MKSYDKNGNHIGTHTCRLTLMERDFVGHITFKIGGTIRTFNTESRTWTLRNARRTLTKLRTNFLLYG